MRFAIALALSAFAAAQNSTNSTSLQHPLKTMSGLNKEVAKVTAAPSGVGNNTSAVSTATWWTQFDGLGQGLIVFAQKIKPSAKATDSVIQGWVEVLAASDDNDNNFYIINNDTQGPYVKTSDLKSRVGCGKPFTMTLPGYQTVMSQMSDRNCSLEVRSNMTANGDGSFTQFVSAGILDYGKYATDKLVVNKQVLKQGAQLTTRHGFNWYANNGKTAALLDHWES